MNELQRANQAMAEAVARMKEESKEKAYYRRNTVCVNCRHAYTIVSGTGIKKHTMFVSCDYILNTGRQRPCAGRDCVEKGVFDPLPRQQRRWVDDIIRSRKDGKETEGKAEEA